MPLILRCVPKINDFDNCICKASLKKSTNVIGWITMVISMCISITCAVRLSQFQENGFRRPLNESKEFLLFELMGHATMATLSFLLLFGVYYGIPVLMLPSLIVQLFAETYLALMHPMFFLVSGVSDAARTMLAIVACIGFIGVFTFFWLVQYNCYRQLVEKRHCTCAAAIKVRSQYPESVMYHTEGNQDDYSALNAVVAMYAFAMINNDHSPAPVFTVP